MFDRSDLSTRPYPALSSGATEIETPLAEAGTSDEGVTLEELPEPSSSTLSTTLPVTAARAYDLFCDSERIPEWMAVVRSSRVICRYEDGRARRTAFIARLERASMGYTLRYDYDDQQRSVRWSTAAEASTVIAGSARFQAIGPRACMMHYDLELYSQARLPAWGDAMYNGHPASAVLSDFREFISRERDL